MKKRLFLSGIFIFAITVFMTFPNVVCASASMSASEYKAGDMVTIEGAIDPGQDLYLVIASQKTFAPKNTEGVHEVKRLKKDAKKKALPKIRQYPFFIIY